MRDAGYRNPIPSHVHRELGAQAAEVSNVDAEARVRFQLGHDADGHDILRELVDAKVGGDSKTGPGSLGDGSARSAPHHPARELCASSEQILLCLGGRHLEREAEDDEE